MVYIKADEEDYLRVMKSVVAEHFDCSNLPTDHPLYSREREHLIGVLKDEVDGKIISAFHVSSAKCYRATFVDDMSCEMQGRVKTKEYASKMYRGSVLTQQCDTI